MEMESYDNDAIRSSETVAGISKQSSKTYGPIYISGDARVQLGDNYALNRDIFETGTPEQKRTAILNLLYYDALDLKREQLGEDEFGPASFAWVKDTHFYTWLESGTTPFWIQGKPASGKSTLMKYLSESRTTLDALRRRGGQWKILHFFFDYRSGQNVANHLLGLLKLFIRQLVEQMPELAEMLTDDLIRQKISGAEISRHVDVLAHLIQKCDLKICAFIDGLDEYDGDAWELTTQLEALHDRTGMKLCLASRAELAFETVFAGLPTIVMQNHNMTSIKFYIQSKITKFRSVHPFQSHLFPESLQTAIAEKAEGVILWARLVIDEMIKSCDTSTVSEDLTVYLESVPPEMEPLYERILTKGSRENQQEASVLLMLIDEDIISTRNEVVLQAWKYIEASCSPQGGLPDRFDRSVCLSRAKALLGGLIDVIEIRAPGGYYRGSNVKSVLRLLHKSLSTYLRKGYRLADRMTERTRRKYANNIWTHLVCSVLLHASRENVIDISHLMIEYKQNVAECGRQDASQIKVDHKVDSLKRQFKRLHGTSRFGTDPERYTIERVKAAIIVPEWAPFSHLIWYCSRNADCCTNLGRDTETSTNDFMMVHTTLCHMCEHLTKPLVANTLARLYQKAMLTWVIAICHGYFQNAVRQLEATRSILTHEDLQALFDMLVVTYFRFEKSVSLWTDREGLRQLVRDFAQSSIYIESNHLCLHDQFWHAHPRDTVSDFISQRPSHVKWSPCHHSICPYKHSDAGLLHHLWQGTIFACSVNDVQLFARLGVNVSGPVYGNGKNVFDRVLCQPFSLASGALLWYGGQNAFVKLADAGVQPDVTGGPSDLLIHAKSLRRKLILKTFSKNNQKHLNFVNSVIRVLEEYKSNGNRWSDLSRLG